MEESMRIVGVDAVKERFKNLFDEFRELAVDSFYEILSSCNFDEEIATQQIRDSFQHSKTYTIPSHLVRNEPESLIPFQSSKKRARSGRLLTPPAEAINSDTEDCIEVDTSRVLSRQFSPFTQDTDAKLSIQAAAEFSSDDDDDDDYPYRPIKRPTGTSPHRIPSGKSRAAQPHAEDSLDDEGKVDKRKVNRDSAGPGPLFSQLRSLPRHRASLPKRRTPPKLSLKIPIEISDDGEDRKVFLLSDSEDESPEPQGASAKRGRPFGFGNLDDSVLSHRLATGAIPLIKQLAGSLFGRKIATVKACNFPSMEGLENITCDPEKLKRLFEEAVEGTSSTENSKFNGVSTWNNTLKDGYGAAIIDGVIYRPAECVLVRVPDKSNSNQESVDKSYNSLLFKNRVPPKAFKFRFARISYIFEEFDRKYAHIHWFKHGSEMSDLAEFAAPHALFLVTECQDVQLSSIAGKIRVDFIDKEASNEIVECRSFRTNHFYCQFHYEETQHKITDAVIHEGKPKICPSNYCGSCAAKEKVNVFQATVPVGSVAPDGSLEAFLQKGVQYRLHDFVYFLPGNAQVVGKSKLADIGQIVRIKIPRPREYIRSKETKRHVELEVFIRLFYRVDELHDQLGLEPHSKRGVHDERMVYMADETIFISSNDLEDKCQIRHSSTIDNLDSYKDKDDTFHVTEQIKTIPGLFSFEAADLQPHELKSSEETEREISRCEAAKAKFLSEGKKLKALELFAGVGGLSLGLELSGAVVTEWMADFAPTTARTAKRNHPGVKVYNEDLGICLKRLVEQEAGIDGHSYKDNNGARVMPMPRIGEVDMIIAGLPCPGYSSANHSPKADDVKNTLILPTLSLIALYRPKYVLLENVKGLITHKLGARQAGKNKVEGGVSMGSMKFIHRALTVLGYQIQYSVLQAGEYGVPQSRQRVFIWAALQGFELPAFPQPTNVFCGRSTEKYSWHKTRRCAPHMGPTMGHTTTDLPKWEWINPHNVVPRSNQENMDRLRRALTIEQVPVLQNQAYVGSNEQHYATVPLSEYQRKLRRNVPNDKLLNHVTPSWFDKPSWNNKNKGISYAKTEQVCSIALKVGADYTTLPPILQPWGLSGKDTLGVERIPRKGVGKFSRLNLDKPYGVCMTTVTPNSKGGSIIHPYLHRVGSVREAARSQGFPDSFKWELKSRLDTRLAYRMIGNAGPIPTSEALGGGLLKVEITRFEANPDATSQTKTPSSPEPATKMEEEQQIVWNDMIERSKNKLEGKNGSSVSKWMIEKGKTVQDAINLDDEEE